MELTVIMSKLCDIQAELLVPKGQKNTFGNYNYRSCEDVLKELKPIAKKHGCVVHMDTDIIHEGDFNYVKATAYLTDVESGAFISAKGFAREEVVKKGMDGSQITGASTSYARKYALAGLFSIDNEKDSDSTNTHETNVKSKPAKTIEGCISELQIQALEAELERTKCSASAVCERYGKKSLAELTQEDYAKASKILAKAETKED